MLTIDNAAAKAAEFIETIPPYPGGYAGQGIVICAGGVKYLTCAWVLINILRRHSCTLPIEVWYLGEDEGDAEWIELVRPLDVTCIDATEVAKQHPHPRLGGWEVKPFAILHSRLEEVLFLDADNVPVVDPTFLFDEPEYVAKGAIFWPDGPRMGPQHPAWALFDVPCRDEAEVESGQALINKRNCWTAINLCDWYNRHSDLFYQYVYGDKDTFRFAWHRTNTPFAIPKSCASMPFTIAQFDLRGNLLFQHRCHDKWSLRGNRRSPKFVWEQECLELVRDLKQRWSPQKHIMRRLSAADREDAARLRGSRMTLLEYGYGYSRLLLDGSGYILDGDGPRDFFWWCENGEVVLAGIDGRVTARLARLNGAGFEGMSVGKQRMKLRLVPTRVA